jgi:hypothetical protein
VIWALLSLEVLCSECDNFTLINSYGVDLSLDSGISDSCDNSQKSYTIQGKNQNRAIAGYEYVGLQEFEIPRSIFIDLNSGGFGGGSNSGRRSAVARDGFSYTVLLSF